MNKCKIETQCIIVSLQSLPAKYLLSSVDLCVIFTFNRFTLILICNRKNTDKMTSLLLMLVILGAFIHSSQAVNCYYCLGCDKPTGSCTGEICIKIEAESQGAFTIFSVYAIVIT